MKNKITLLLMVCMPLIVHGQVYIHQVICSSGDLADEANISMQWHLGELAIITLSNEGHDVTQGFGQYDYVVTGITSPGKDRLNVEVYPNPVIETLHIAIRQSQSPTFLQLFDLNGRLVLRSTIEDDIFFLEMQDFLPGMYFLRIYQHPYKFAEFKIIKKTR